MTAINILCQGHVRTIGEAVDSWKQEHDEAMIARELEELIPYCDDGCSYLEKWHKAAWNEVFTNRQAPLQRIGNEIAGAVDGFLKHMEALQGQILLMENKEYKIENADKLPRIVERAQAIQKNLIARWPFLRPEDMKPATETYYTLDSIINELQGPHPK